MARELKYNPNGGTQEPLEEVPLSTNSMVDELLGEGWNVPKG